MSAGDPVESERSPAAVPPPDIDGGSAAQQGQVYLSTWPTRLLNSPLVPRSLLISVARGAARLMRLRIERRDRLEAKNSPLPPRDHEPALWFADIYHGGVTFWDWIVLPGGGLWWEVLWPLVARTSVDRLRRYPEARTILELDAHTYEELAGRSPSDLEALRSVVATGRMEIVNGTYAQPLAPTVGAEANLRHFFYGLDAIEGILGAEVKSFVAGEPQFVPQLPQILSDCGIENLVFRTHWAPFGIDPEADAEVVRWRGPDGSEVRTVPRYSFMDYRLQMDTHPGVQNAGLTGDDFETWTGDDKDRFAAEAKRRRVDRPFVTRLADPKPPESPFPGILAAARRSGSRMATVREYCELPHQNQPEVSYRIDDIPTTIPWGLAGEQLHREQVAAETALLIAERLDAILETMGLPEQQARLDSAWKLLMRAQHHDLHLCAPWHSVRHGLSMGEIGCRFAREGREEADGVARVALKKLAECFGPKISEGRSFLLFNPSPWPRRELIELPGAERATEVSLRGARLESQVIRSDAQERTVSLVVDLPPLGVEVLELRSAAPAAAAERKPTEIDPSVDLIAREAPGRSLGGGYLTVWRGGRLERSTVDRILLEEEGSALRRYRLEGRIADLPFVQWLTAIPDLNRIDLTTEIDFGGGMHPGPQLADHRSDLAYYVQDHRKLCLNFESEFSRTFCDSPFSLEEPTGPRVTAGSLLGLERGEGSCVALHHRGTPGWHLDRESGLARNVLGWGPEQWLYASDDSITPGRSRYTAIQGLHRYHHQIAQPKSRLDAIRSAHDFRLPVLTVELGNGTAAHRAPWSFLEVAPEKVILTALFARDGRTHARLWNASDEPADVSLIGGRTVETAVSLRLEEQATRGWPRLRPWGFQTIRLEEAGKTAEAPNRS
jgi:hypothetical protein